MNKRKPGLNKVRPGFNKVKPGLNKVKLGLNKGKPISRISGSDPDSVLSEQLGPDP